MYEHRFVHMFIVGLGKNSVYIKFITIITCQFDHMLRSFYMWLHTDLDTDVFVFFALYMDNYIAPQQSYIEYPYRLCVHRYSLLIVFVTLSMTILCLQHVS